MNLTRLNNLSIVMMLVTAALWFGATRFQGGEYVLLILFLGVITWTIGFVALFYVIVARGRRLFDRLAVEATPSNPDRDRA